MADGRTIRVLCVVDDATRECLCMDVDFSFPARRVVQAWAAAQEIEPKYIQPGNPQQNAYVESFNRTVRQ